MRDQPNGLSMSKGRRREVAPACRAAHRGCRGRRARRPYEAGSVRLFLDSPVKPGNDGI